MASGTKGPEIDVLKGDNASKAPVKTQSKDNPGGSQSKQKRDQMPQDISKPSDVSDIEEGLGAYHPGGFHPVRLGDVYHNRYKVLSKLGYGRYSTVWLALDQRAGTEEYRALKFLSAECYEAGENFWEREVLMCLREGDKSHPGYSFISLLLDNFEHKGPNGTHYCFVFDAMGETLRSFGTWFIDHMVPNQIMKNITIQLLLALDYAHDHCVIHTDIKPDNILVKMKDKSLIAKRYLPAYYALAVPNSDGRLAHASDKYVIMPSMPLKGSYFSSTDDLFDLEIALGDWGAASWTSKHLTELIQPVALRAPEVLIQAPWDATTDLWNLGAVVIEVFRAVRLFSGRVPPYGHYEVREHIREIVDLFGPFPMDFVQRGKREVTEAIFDGEGHVKNADPMKRPPLESEAFLPKLKEEDRKQFAAFLRSLMRIDPKERKSTMDLLRQPWLGAAN